MRPQHNAPAPVPLRASMITFRDRIVPLADLRGSFGMEAHANTADSRIIVIELDVNGDPFLIGLTADRVNEVTVLHAGDAEEAPVIGMRWPRDHVRCLVRREGDLVVLPDLTALFARLTSDAETTIH